MYLIKVENDKIVESAISDVMLEEFTEVPYETYTEIKNYRKYNIEIGNLYDKIIREVLPPPEPQPTEIELDIIEQQAAMYEQQLLDKEEIMNAIAELKAMFTK